MRALGSTPARRGVGALALALAALLPVISGGCGPPDSARRASTLDRIIATRTLRIGLNPGYAPFEMVDPSGAMVGFDLDLAGFLAKQIGDDVKVEVVKSDWDPIIANLNSDKFDVILSGMTRTPQRALRCGFSAPYFTTGQTLLLNRAKHPEGSVCGPADLDRPGVVVATKLGTTGEIAARKAFRRATIKTLETETDAALEVEAGRADVMVYDQPYIAIRAKQARERCWALLTPFTSEGLAMAVRRDDVEFRQWLDVCVEELRSSGAWDELYRKWFVEMAWLPAGADSARAAAPASGAAP